MTAIDVVPVSEGTRILHIGPHKTGTSSLQSAFHLARRSAARHGVHYAGPNRQPLAAAQAVAARGTKRESTRPIGPWLELLREVRAASAARVVISSEWFSDARAEAIRRIVEDLDPDRLRVIVTVRPLASVLPSQWQQFVVAGRSEAYEAFLDSVFGEPTSASRAFWHRHRHDELVARWAAAAGHRNIAVVVADDRDHGVVLRAFERLVGLPPGLLAPEDERSNRSLTRPEIELVRQLNLALADRGMEPHVAGELVLFGAAVHLRARQPVHGEPRIATPDWALERAAEVGAEIARGIAESGVRVIGDLSLLESPPPHVRAPTAPSGDKTELPWPDVAATGAMGVLLASGLGRAHGDGGRGPWEDGVTVAPHKERVDLDGISTPRLRNVFLARARAAARGWLPRPRRRPTTGVAASPIHSSRSEVE